MGFCCSLLVEVLGGVATAGLLAGAAAMFAGSAGAAAREREAEALNEDARRFIRDRDHILQIELTGTENRMSACGQQTSGALSRQLAALKRRALHEYRDEMALKRRRYAALCEAEGGRMAQALRRRRGALPPFELTDESRRILRAWREDARVEATGATHPVDDPTSEALEPELRQWERYGDHCS